MSQFPPDPAASDTARFETFVRVRNCDVDALGHTNNASYVNYIEQAAVDHAHFLGLSLERTRKLGGVFVARQHTIQFVRPTFSGELLRVVTWLGPVHGARVERRYRILRVNPVPTQIPVAGRSLPGDDGDAGQEVVCLASTEWVFVAESGQPRRIPAEIVSQFDSVRHVTAVAQ